MYVNFFLIHWPDLFRTGYQNQVISSLEQGGQVCESPAAHPHPRRARTPSLAVGRSQDDGADPGIFQI